MSRSGKPFPQAAKRLPDGRSVVTVTVFDPFIVDVVLISAGRKGALDRVRELGGRDVHLSKSFRPPGAAIDMIMRNGLDGVFAPQPLDGTWLPLLELPAFLDGTSRQLVRYDTDAFVRWFAQTGVGDQP